jgi:hypothetical protein
MPLTVISRARGAVSLEPLTIRPHYSLLRKYFRTNWVFGWCLGVFYVYTFMYMYRCIDSRRSSEMAKHWRGLCPAVDCGRLMMMMMDRCIVLCIYKNRKKNVYLSVI